VLDAVLHFLSRKQPQRVLELSWVISFRISWCCYPMHVTSAENDAWPPASLDDKCRLQFFQVTAAFLMHFWNIRRRLKQLSAICRFRCGDNCRVSNLWMTLPTRLLTCTRIQRFQRCFQNCTFRNLQRYSKISMLGMKADRNLGTHPAPQLRDIFAEVHV
jgi:hypothetical protein